MKTMNPQAIFAALLFLYGLITPSVAVCYHPNGESAGSEYQSCNTSHPDVPSMCCASGRTDNTQNYCRDDGLCDSPGTRELWQESCTDPTWQDLACVNLCSRSNDPNLLNFKLQTIGHFEIQIANPVMKNAALMRTSWRVKTESIAVTTKITCAVRKDRAVSLTQHMILYITGAILNSGLGSDWDFPYFSLLA
jgi:hypothetical protein